MEVSRWPVSTETKQEGIRRRGRVVKELRVKMKAELRENNRSSSTEEGKPGGVMNCRSFGSQGPETLTIICSSKPELQCEQQGQRAEH